MTPPDSDDLDRVTALAIAAHALTESEPDSDAREAVKHGPLCATKRGKWCDCAAGAAVLLPLHLAQRILAALEEAAELDRDSGHYERADKNRVLAAELRAHLTKEPK